MVKFEKSGDSAFRTVAAALVMYCEDAEEVVGRKWKNADRNLRDEREQEAKEIVLGMQPVGERSCREKLMVERIEEGGEGKKEERIVRRIEEGGNKKKKWGWRKKEKEETL